MLQTRFFNILKSAFHQGAFPITGPFALSLPFSFITVLFLSPALADTKPLIGDGLALYFQQDTQKAYAQFEAIFDDLKYSEAERTKAAQILAFAPNSCLKLRKRHRYAMFYLNHGKNIPEYKFPQFYRIAADGLFDDRMFGLARKYYEKLATHSDVRNQAYATYRLGWIELNENRPEKTVSLWKTFLEQKGMLLSEKDSDLAKSIVRDLGKSWIETLDLEVDPKGRALEKNDSPGFSQIDWSSLEILTQKSTSPQLEPNYRNEFVSGVVTGVKRILYGPQLNRLRNILRSSDLYLSVLQAALEKDAGFVKFPCQITSWVDSSVDLESLPREKILTALNACGKMIVKNKQCSLEVGHKTTALYERMSFLGEQLYPRVSLWVACQKSNLACRDLLILGRFEAETNKKSFSEKDLRAVYDACTPSQNSSSSSESTLKEVRNHLSTLVKHYARAGLVSNSLNQKDPFYALLRNSLEDIQVRTLVTADLLSDPKTFDSTYLPSLLIQMYSHEETMKYGEEFLKSFSLASLGEVRAELLDTLVRQHTKDREFELAKMTLETYGAAAQTASASQVVPSTSAVIEKPSTPSPVWEEYWLSLDETSLKVESDRFENWMQATKLQKISKERQLRLLTLSLLFDRIDLIWENWTVFQPHIFSQSQAKLRQAVFEKTLLEIQTQPTSQTSVQSQKYVEGKVLARIASKDVHLSSNQIRNTLKTPTLITKDFPALEKIATFKKQIKRSKIKFNGLFAQRLTYKLSLLKKQEKLLSTTTWTDEAYLNHAKSLISDTNRHLLENLTTIIGQLKSQPELSEVAEQITAIESQLKEKIEELQPKPEEPKERA